MQYFGGKAKTAKYIAAVIKEFRKENQLYVEPFVGAGWVMSKMDGERQAYDKHPYLISMYKELQKGWIPPKKITEEEYQIAKFGECDNHLKGFIGFGCSFSGKWFGGFARSGKRNYCLNAHNSVLRKMKAMIDVEFECKDYRELNLNSALIYCDPPYQGTTQYGKIVGEFDTNEFWETVRKWSKNNTVVVSEYIAPDDFIEIWRKEVKTDIRNKDNKKEDRIEKLFIHKSLLKEINKFKVA